MALQATFRADTEQFDAALAKAVQSVKVFGQNASLTAGTVSRDLQRMVTSFDGSKVFADAQKVVAAVQSIGGASKLTEAEQRKVNASVTEALAKYKALGQEAPDALSKLARETAQAEKSMGGLKGAISTAVGTFAGFVTAQAVIGGVKTAVAGVGAVLQSAFATNASLEKTTLQFQTLMGNADQAKTHVKGLFDFAKATPFETQPIIEASRALQVFGGSALNTKGNLTLIGDAAAATGAPINELSTWVGKMYANLAAGRPIGEAAARLTELGVIGPQARAALEQVAAGGGSIETKFKVVQDVLGNFTGAMQLQAGTWDGVMSSFADTVNLTLADAFRGLYETVRDSMGNVVTILGSAGVTGALEAVGRAVMNAFGTEQTAQVAGMTRAFVAIGQGAVTAAEYAIRAWAAVETVVLSALAAINVENARVMTTLASMPVIGGQFKEAAAYADAFALSLVKDTVAARANRDGQSELVKSLQTLRTELGKAGADAVAMAKTTATTGTAAKTAATATTGLGIANEKAAKEAQKHADALARVSGADKVQAALALTRLIQELGGTSKVAASQFAEINKTLTNGIVVGTELGMRLPSAMVQFARETQTANTQLVAMAEILKTLPSYVERIPVPMPALPGVVNGLPSNLTDYAHQVSTPGVNGAPVPTGRGVPDWKTIFSGVPQQLVNIFSEGNGNKGEGIGALAGQVGGQWLGNMVSMAAKAVGSSVGALAGTAIPIVGPLIGGFLGKAVAGLFGPSKDALATQQANANIAKTQQGLTQQFGGVEQIAGMNTAGQALAAAWGSKGTAGEAHFATLAAEFTRMTQEQNALLSEQERTIADIAALEERRNAAVEALKPTWAAVSELASKYQINVAGLGATVAQLGTTASFKTLLDDIQTFERAGADVGGMLFGMREEISKVVSESQRLGTEIPANMRPYVEELFRSGNLLDENGKKVTSLAGIKWGAPVETQADQAKAAIGKMDETLAKLRETLDKVVEALARMLPQAAQDGARGVEDAFSKARPTIKVGFDYGDYDPTAPTAPEGFATGSGGIRNFGRGTLAMLHGREGVFTEAQIASLQRRSGAGSATVINFHNPVVREDADLSRLARMVDAALSRRWSLTERVSWAGAA